MTIKQKVLAYLMGTTFLILWVTEFTVQMFRSDQYSLLAGMILFGISWFIWFVHIIRHAPIER